ncbi:MAG: GNAT family N-acetyltransferase [Blastocatellia bacterium]
MTVPEIETARLRLRRFRPDDLTALTLILCDPSVTLYIGAGAPVRTGEVPYHLQQLTENYWTEYGFGRWAVVYRETGELAGYCGLRVNEGKPELHYLLGRAWWCAGLATEAARACLDYAFTKLRLSEVIALVRPENTASVRVLKKIGMQHTGKQACYFNYYFYYYVTTSPPHIERKSQ